MNNKPKVEIQLNESATLKLLKDKAFTGENQHGPYYMYNVEHEGQEKVLFATPEVHQAILESGLKTGDAFSIKKTAVQNGKKIGSNVEFAVVNKQNGQAPATAPGTNGNGHPTVDDGLKMIMEGCLKDAVAITQSVNTMPWRTEDVRGIALTMFIQRSKH